MVPDNSKTADKTAKPRGKPFTKGDSRINRKGRPKVGKTLAEMVRDALNEPADGKNPDYTKLHKMIDTGMKQALKGDFRFVEYLLARGYGKLLDRVFVDTPNRKVDLSQLTDVEMVQVSKPGFNLTLRKNLSVA